MSAWRTCRNALAATAVALLLLWAAWPADAHEAPEGWSYPLACCSNHDCRAAEVGEVQETAEGYLLVSTGELVPFGDRRIKEISPDGRFHVCQQGGNFDTGRVLCLLTPMRAS